MWNILELLKCLSPGECRCVHFMVKIYWITKNTTNRYFFPVFFFLRQKSEENEFKKTGLNQFFSDPFVFYPVWNLYYLRYMWNILHNFPQSKAQGGNITLSYYYLWGIQGTVIYFHSQIHFLIRDRCELYT